MADIVPATSPQQEFAESSYGPIDSNALLSVPSSPPSKSSPVVTLQPAQDMSYSTVHHGDVLQAPPLNDSPERKMLRLNARGRFSSPVLNRLHQDTAEGTKPKTRKSRRARGQRKHLLVVCAYGSDVSSRTDIARRIEQILKGAMTTNKATSKDLGVPPEPSGPPKPTHPFFLSKSGHSQEPGLTAQSSPGVLSKPRQEQLETRKTSAVTPGKLRSQIQVRQDDRAFSGFGIGAFGSTQDRSMIKHPGACEPAWPSRGAAHVRGPQECPSRPRSRGDESPNSSVVSVVRGQRKLKYKAIRIAEDENIISKFDQALHFSQGDVVDEYGFKRPPAALRIPERLLITGSELEMMVRKRVRAHLPDPVSVVGDPRSTDDELHGSDLSTTHPALSALYGSIADTLTPFDQCRYEQQMWVQKYAPKTADQVLQSRKEVATLRDWLGKLTISAVESGNKPPPNSSTKLENKKPRKKRRKRAEELEGFIVSSDENACDMDELTDPEDAVQLDGLRPLQKRSQVRVGIQDADTSTKFSSATLLSGPHGCGKTAAVFAVAKELGFEVFEINAGSRRSGKDIIDRVGNMSQNHQVQRAQDDSITASADEDLDHVSETLRRDLSSGRQGTMNSFFSPKAQKKEEVKSRPKKAAVLPTKNDSKEPGIPRLRRQKQSLILLEEVDVLFEEDKQFWTTVLELIAHSKRPLIMTCNDESVVPLHIIPLHAILRFTWAPLDLATDYLLLLAAREGHVLERNAVSSLYEAKSYDLRASITELDFWCQMAVGDPKGGLSWLYQRWPPGKDVDEQGRTLRVVSKGTYEKGMGWLDRDISAGVEAADFDAEAELLLQARESWDLEVGVWQNLPSTQDFQPFNSTADYESAAKNRPREDVLSTLKQLGHLLDGLSAADVYCKIGAPSTYQERMDPTQPTLSERARANYAEGDQLIQADTSADYTNLDLQLLLATQLLAKRSVLNSNPRGLDEGMHPPHDLQAHILRGFSLAPVTEATIISAIIDRNKPHLSTHALTRHDFSLAFDPIAAPPTSALSAATGMLASVFDRPFNIVTTDLAPYARGIVRYDLRLEEQRLRLSGLVSQGGQPGKRVRTTRAARSALEGGKRESTRRERWFPKALNMALVLRTGGREWGRAVSEVEGEREGEGFVPSQGTEERRGSVGSAEGSVSKGE
ncbi:hypothetical protein LTR04_006092 [Oleoguttula sp. CCFEE 6159]|nr:hypothetical protein LTR04_006092 [Oleoguttula sp. CCFEE 6159]